MRRAVHEWDGTHAGNPNASPLMIERVDLLQAPEGPDQETRANQHRQSQGHFRNHQSAAQALAASGRASGSFLERLGQIRTRNLPGGRGAEDQAG